MEESDLFRHQYSLFWKALFLMDNMELRSITADWGIEDVTLFASATLQRPYDPQKAVHLSSETITLRDVYKMQMMSKDRLRQFLSDTDKIPRELIMIGRNMNLVRSNNKEFGSPVNRINIMALWAVRGLGSDWSSWDNGGAASADRGLFTAARESIYPRFNYWLFRCRLFALSLTFYMTRLVQQIKEMATGSRGRGFEDVLDAQMAAAIKDKIGIDIHAKSNLSFS
jgi:aarF domain-containing kinase